MNKQIIKLFNKIESMIVIENINIAYVSQDLSLLSSADADGRKDLRYLSVFAIGCMILPLREDRRNCLFNGYFNSFRIVLAVFTAWSSYRQSICVSVLFIIFSDYLINLFIFCHDRRSPAIYDDAFNCGTIKQEKNFRIDFKRP